MSTLRKKSWIFILPLLLALAGMPLGALATFTTGTNKTIGGGFTGGTVSGATTFSSTVTFSSGFVVNGSSTINAPTEFSNNQVLSFGTGSTQGAIGYSTIPTPDYNFLWTGPNSNSWHIQERADAAFDFQNCSAGTSAATDPLLCIHSHNQNTTQWIDFKHDGTNGVIDVGTGVVSFPDGVTITGDLTTSARVLAKTGTVGSPSLGFTIDGGTGTGFYLITNGEIGVAEQGALGAQFRAGYVRGENQDIALNADYTNATAGFTNTALSTTVISGRTYSFILGLTFADSTAADGAQFDFNGGSAAATNFRVQCTSSNATGTALVLTNAGTTALATAVQVALALTTQAGITCNGTFVPSGSGTFIVRAAQTAHSTGTLTVHRGSWLNIRDTNPK